MQTLPLIASSARHSQQASRVGPVVYSGEDDCATGDVKGCPSSETESEPIFTQLTNLNPSPTSFQGGQSEHLLELTSPVGPPP